MRKMLLQGIFWKHLIYYRPQSGEYPMLKCIVITNIKKIVPRKNIARFRSALFSYLVKSLEYTSSNLTQVETLQYVNWPFSLSPSWCIDVPALFKTWQWHVPTECARAPIFYYIRTCPFSQVYSKWELWNASNSTSTHCCAYWKYTGSIRNANAPIFRIRIQRLFLCCPH